MRSKSSTAGKETRISITSSKNKNNDAASEAPGAKKPKRKRVRSKIIKQRMLKITPSLFEILVFLTNHIYLLMIFLIYEIQMKYYATLQEDYTKILPGITEVVYEYHIKRYAKRMKTVSLAALLIYSVFSAEAFIRFAAFMIEKSELFSVSENFVAIFYGILYAGVAFSLSSTLGDDAPHFGRLLMVIRCILVPLIYIGGALVKTPFYRYYLRLVFVGALCLAMNILDSQLASEAQIKRVYGGQTPLEYASAHGADVGDFAKLADDVLGRLARASNASPVESIKYYFIENKNGEHDPIFSLSSLRANVVYITPRLALFGGKTSVFDAALAEKVSELALQQCIKTRWFMIVLIGLFVAIVSVFTLLFQEKISYFNTFFSIVWLGIFLFQACLAASFAFNYFFKCQSDDLMFSGGYADGFVELIKGSYYGKAIDEDYNFYSHRGHMLLNSSPSSYCRLRKAQKYITATATAG